MVFTEFNLGMPAGYTSVIEDDIVIGCPADGDPFLFGDKLLDYFVFVLYNYLRHHSLPINGPP